MSKKSSFTIQARVADEAINKVSRLFNASIDDIILELMQNARRAGASRVMIDQIDDTNLGPSIRIADDGPGLANINTLFSLGYSAWSEEVIQSEDAAGMGFFALANRGAQIIAQILGTNQSWSLEASAAAFSGKEPIIGNPGPEGHRGVTVIFPAKEYENIAGSVKSAARYFVLPVLFNGEEMDRADFLAEADYTELWNGIRIGIFEDHAYKSFNHKRANFYGVTLDIHLPSVKPEHHKSLFARIDVINCAELKLVLPARKEVIQNEAYLSLCEAIERLYFRLIHEHGPHSLSHKDYLRARALGIDLEEAAPWLRPFSPQIADVTDAAILPELENVPANVSVLYEGENSLEEQNLAHALEFSDSNMPVYRPNASFKGYSWYNKLSAISLKSYRMAKGDHFEEIEPDGGFSLTGRPDKLQVIVGFEDSLSRSDMCLGTDLLVIGEEYAQLCDVNIHPIENAIFEPDDLVSFMQKCLYCPSDDAEAGSYIDQERWFLDEAEDIAIKLLQSEEAAKLNAIKCTIECKLLWQLPKDRKITITIDQSNIMVEGLLSDDL